MRTLPRAAQLFVVAVVLSGNPAGSVTARGDFDRVPCCLH